MNINLLASETFPDKEICTKCKHYKESKDPVWGIRQVIDEFCCKCYSNKVYIITRFEKRDKNGISQNNKI